MKRNLFFLTSIVLVCGSLAAYLLAQQIAPTSTTSILQDAIALYNEGKPQEAKELIAGIAESDPDYAVARCYNALCQYALNDKLGFLNTAQSAAVQQAVISPELREELAGREIEALFFYRQFEELLPKIRAFRSEHPASTRLEAVRETQLAALFDRGMKKAHEASMHGDTNKFNARWTDGKTNLQEFLSLASSFTGTNYSVVPKRNLREDVWVARVTLGDETAALEEVPIQDLANREKFSLLRVKLYKKLRPHAVDENLQRMTEFLQQFPNSKYCKRVEFDMAGVALLGGERLSMEAEAAERAGDTAAATAKRALAAPYFDSARTLFNPVVEDKEAGLEAAEVRESREGLLRASYWQKDYANLATLTAQQIANSRPAEKEWLQAKLFDGAALVRQVKLNEAATVLDELLAFGFKKHPTHDGLIAMATKWRVFAALRTGDLNTARQLVQWVQSSDCTKSIKEAFVKSFPNLAAQTQPEPTTGDL